MEMVLSLLGLYELCVCGFFFFIWVLGVVWGMLIWQLLRVQHLILSHVWLQHFEDFVMGHFRNRARDILVACKAYMEGAQVGSLVKGGVQDVDVGDRSCSKRFKDSLAGYVDMLVKAFTQIGAEGCEIFQSPAMNGNKRFCGMPKAAT